MNLYLTLTILVAGTMAIVLAITQFVKTPRNIKFTFSSFGKDSKVEYAPEFSLM